MRNSPPLCPGNSQGKSLAVTPTFPLLAGRKVPTKRPLSAHVSIHAAPTSACLQYTRTFKRSDASWRVNPGPPPSPSPKPKGGAAHTNLKTLVIRVINPRNPAVTVRLCSLNTRSHSLLLSYLWTSDWMLGVFCQSVIEVRGTSPLMYHIFWVQTCPLAYRIPDWLDPAMSVNVSYQTLIKLTNFFHKVEPMLVFFSTWTNLTVVDYLPKLRLKVSRYLLIIINPSFIFLTTVQLHRAPDTETMIEHVEVVHRIDLKSYFKGKPTTVVLRGLGGLVIPIRDMYSDLDTPTAQVNSGNPSQSRGIGRGTVHAGADALNFGLSSDSDSDAGRGS
ncbi:hypothetical protein B0H13DRAFT_1914760 [Mycena leptocephala]|nr:hypothetical protein B0H13DRAFT_1914760 [Mycena leptocephala]